MAPKPILLADDDANEAFLAVRAFQDAGVPNPVATVADVDAAIAYLSSHPAPVLALLDHNLAGRSGLEVLQWLRAQSPLCTLPVLMLSASTYDSDVRAAYLLGANGYLVKPATFEEMQRTVIAIKSFWLEANRAA